MTENKWTPGPWSMQRAIYPADGEYDYAIAAVIDGRRLCIGEAFGRADTAVRPPAEANARLIAAAPEMAEALENCIAAMGEGGSCSNRWTDALSAANAALAKVRGES